ncbi:MAG: DUF1684 domain-containing protein [Chloroflexi bacterium]|nr:DUF1684 domain-containing protein [Chloroflexota bacterium]
MTTTMDDHTAYTTAIEAWRKEQEARLRSEIGWLTVVGLCWLDEGVNTIGSDPSGAVVLPERLPAQLGVITLTHGTATLHISADADVLIDGVPSREAVLYYEGEHITLVQIDGVTFFVIKRGERLALRVRDVESAARRTFGGRQWFPVDPAYRVVGTFHAHPDGRQIEVETVIGTTVIYRNPGVVTFELHGTPQHSKCLMKVMICCGWCCAMARAAARPTGPRASCMRRCRPTTSSTSTSTKPCHRRAPSHPMRRARSLRKRITCPFPFTQAKSCPKAHPEW